jgi:L-ascorbate metabolism protein UlaG (beta-lactamase superfamily)
MKISALLGGVIIMALSSFATGAQFETDSFSTSKGELKITFIGHASLILTFNKMEIYVDPYGKLADYSKLPKADMILITHDHMDHFDTSAINLIRTEKTIFIETALCADRLKTGIVMKNGDAKTEDGIKIEAVPAYNIIHKRDNGQPFHPKGVGNGYVITIGNKQIYIAGDTENIPEMKALKNIDIAFLPMNLPYTMTPEMAADAAKSFEPKILYPYHFGNTDCSKIVDLLKNEKAIDLRIRKMM